MRCSCVANVLLMCRTLLHCQNTCVSSIPCNVYDKFHQKKTRKQKAESIVLPKYLFCVQSHVMCVTKSIRPLSTFRLSLLSQPFFFLNNCQNCEQYCENTICVCNFGIFVGKNLLPHARVRARSFLRHYFPHISRARTQ